MPHEATVEEVRSSRTPGPRLTKRQVLVIGLLLLIGIVNYLDRSTLAIANSTISGELGLSATDMGILLSVFSWSYAFAQLPAGPLLDRFGARTVLGIGLLVWSVAQGAGGLVRGMHDMLITRVVVGLGEGPMFPANAKVVSESFPKDRRGFPLGVTTSASTIGPAIAPPLLTWLMLTFGWRAMFITMGVVGVVLALAWLMLYRNPELQNNLDQAVDERHGLTSGGRRTWSFKEWFYLLRFRTTWSMIGGFIGVIYSIYLYLTWLPAYFEKAHGISIADVGVALIFPYVAGTLGMLGGGALGDVIARRAQNVTRARKWPVVLGLLVGGLCSLPAALTESTVMSIIWICCAQFFINMASSGAWAMAATLADERTTGSLGSLQNFGGYFGGAFAPLITGILLDATGSFVAALMIASLVAVAAAFLYAFGVNQPIPPYPGHTEGSAR